MSRDEHEHDSHVSDEALMAAYVRGDEAAFRQLFDRYAPILFRMVRRRLRSDEDASDVVQQALLHMHRARHDFRGDSKLRPWLFTIAKNLLREYYRRAGRRRETPLQTPSRTIEPSVEAPKPLEAEQQAQRVREALGGLPDNQREVIELHWFDELPYDEISQIVGASVGAVRVRAHRGYARLRELLEEKP